MNNLKLATALSVVFVSMLTLLTAKRYNLIEFDTVTNSIALNTQVVTAAVNRDTSTSTSTSNIVSVNTDKVKPNVTDGYSYIVRGKRYNVISSNKAKDFSQQGIASWYGPGFHGKKTATGEIYNQNALTGAHKSLPLSTKVKVTNVTTNKSIIIRINDRGPYHGKRIIDLSKKSAELLGILKHGTGMVKLQVIN